MDRKQMMADCPEVFEDKLQDILDHIEDRVNDAKANLDINGIGDIGNIDEAFDIVKELSSDLY